MGQTPFPTAAIYPTLVLTGYDADEDKANKNLAENSIILDPRTGSATDRRRRFLGAIPTYSWVRVEK